MKKILLKNYLADIHEILQMIEQNRENEISLKYFWIKKLNDGVAKLESKK